MRQQLVAVLVVLTILTTAVVAGAGIAGPEPAQFLKLYDTESGRRYMVLYVIGVSDALQLSNQIECHHEKGTGPSAETMMSQVADVLRGPDAPKAVAIAVLRVLRAGGCTTRTR
jgi:hypothetical protein